MWFVEKIEISGGFLPGLTVNIPRGLTCIIGARGSGKSTLAEAVRFALCGLSAAPKQCVELVQANLAGGALVTITATSDGSNRYTIKRSLKQSPVLLTSDEKAINTVDLDRGTFLPLDAYGSLEIEAIADEALGDKRRNLLDELRSEQMRTIHLSLGEGTRALEANADRIRTTQRTIEDLTEQIEELGDIRGRLSAIGLRAVWEFTYPMRSGIESSTVPVVQPSRTIAWQGSHVALLAALVNIRARPKPANQVWPFQLTRSS